MNNDEMKFFVINTEALWEEGEPDGNLLVNGDGVSLAKSSDYSYVDTFVPGSVMPQSLDRDACGVLYILDDLEKRILVFEIQNRYSRWLKCLALRNPVSIAVSDTDIYVVEDTSADSAKGGDEFKGNWVLYCFARVNRQIRWKRRIGENARIATAGNDELYILDSNGGRVFKGDREGEVEKIKLTNENEKDYPLDEPIDIASDREGNFYILEGQERKILKFNSKGQLQQSITIPFKQEVTYLSLAVESSDSIFLGFKDTAANGNDKKTGDVLRLSKDVKYDAVGVYTSKLFDSTIAGCRWHRVVMEADIPANTRVLFSYSAADSKLGIDASFNGEHLVNPGDTLLNHAKGRHLQFKIQLLSDETCSTTPLVKRIKIYFPRITYLRYLPGTFQEDEKKREFLERFLSLFETFMSYSEEQVYNFTRYLDTAAVPGKFIPWLSSWLAIAHDENWPLERKRRLLQKAPALYKKRGTPHALSETIQLFYDKAPAVVEPFQFDCIDIEDDEFLNYFIKLVERLFDIKSEGKRLGTDHYRFTVLVPPRWEDPDDPVKKAKEVTETELITLQRILDTEKPAHTNGTLLVLEPWFYLDMHTYLEVNTVLNKSEFVLDKSTVLGRDTVIYGKEQAGQVGRKSRIGMDLILT